MRQAEFDPHIGHANICANVQAAPDRARVIHEAAAAGPAEAR